LSLVWNVFARGRRFEEVFAWPYKSKTRSSEPLAFRPAVIVRTPAELKDLIARTPFAGPRGIEPNKLLVVFLVGGPDENARAKVLATKTDPEELRMEGRELYMYFPESMAPPKVFQTALILCSECCSFLKRRHGS